MSYINKIIRPVGNPIDINKKIIDKRIFTPFSVSFYNSGTASLSAAIIASRKFKPNIKRPEVIIPAYGCPDLISAIVYAGATPVLVDLEENSSSMSPNLLSMSINENTIAVITIRFFGISEQYESLSNLTKKHNVVLIEDSAQGFPISSINTYWQGDFIILSFGRGKPVNLLGGGAVLSRKQELVKLLPSPSPTQNKLTNKIKYLLKVHLYNQTIQPLAYGLIARIPGLKIGETRFKPLNKIENINPNPASLLNANLQAYKTHKNCQQKYNGIFKKINNDIIIDLPERLAHNMAQPLLRYPILIKNDEIRDKLYEKLRPYGATLMYKEPLNKIEGVGKHLLQKNEYPNAEKFAHQLLTLPTHEAVDNKTLRIIEKIFKGI